MTIADSKQGHMLSLLREFRCLGADCEDTCCQRWDMQVNPATVTRYRQHAPELLEAIEETPGGIIMKRDPVTHHCLQLTQGMCGIQTRYGESLLGDACYLYPRSVRALQAVPVMAATLSCPEIARLALRQESALSYQQATFDRVPETLREYAPEGMTPEQCLAIAHMFQQHIYEGATDAGAAMAALSSVAYSLDNLPVSSWLEAVPFYLRTAAQRTPAADMQATDLVKLLHALIVLLVSMKHRPSARLQAVLDAMAQALQAQIEWETASVQAEVPPQGRYLALETHWKNHPSLERHARAMAQLLVALHLFPFGGQAERISEKARLILFRFALYRLAMAAYSLTTQADEAACVAAIQPLARFLDHLQESQVTLLLCQEAGWDKAARMHGLLKAGGFCAENTTA